MMSKVLIRVGGNIDGWCTRCKMILAHTIEAAVGNDVKRAQCNTCRSTHVFRANAPGTKVETERKTRKPRELNLTSGKKSTAGMAKKEHFQALMQGRDTSSAREYAVFERFSHGEVLAHTVFGMGVVTADKGGNKIEVLFPLGPKVLVHNVSA